MADDSSALYRIELDIQSLKRQTEEVTNLIHGIGNKAESEGNRIDGVFKKIGGAVAGYFTAQQALSFAQSIVQVRSEIEGLEVSFTTLLGSKEKASQLFGELRQFAVQTPMMLNDLSKGAQTLLSFNYDADKVMPTLKALGDISMGDSQKFQSLTLAFSQMSSTGKLMGQDLLQMINAGFNPLAEISTKTGKSIGELKEEMSKGAISAQMVEDAFISATSEGGKFYGMLEAQSKTTAGALSNLQGAWEDMLNAIGEEAQGAFVGVIEDLSFIVKHYEDLGRVLAELIGIYGSYRVAVVATTVAESAAAMATKGYTAAEIVQYGWLVLCEKAQALLNKTLLKNPYALAAAAVVALGVAIYETVKKQNELTEEMKAVEEATTEYNKSVATEQLEIDRLFGKLKAAKEGTEEYNKAKQAIINNYGKYLEGLSDEIKSLKDVEGAYKAIGAAALDAAKKKALANATSRAADAFVGSTADVGDQMYEVLKKKYKGAQLEEQYEKAMNVLRSGGEWNEDWLNQFNEHRDRAGDFYGYTANDMKKLIQEYKAEEAKYNEAIKEAERRFGTEMPEEEAAEEVETPTEPTDDEKKEAEKRKKKALEMAQAKRERLAQIKDYREGVTAASREAELAIAQAEIDAMDEGLEKTLAQNRLNFEKARYENEEREKEMLEAYRDAMELEWQNANPDYKETGKVFNREGITELPAEQSAIIKKYSDLATQEFNTANREALTQALSQYQTYEQQRLEITRKYQAMINALYEDDGNGGKRLREGVSQGNIDNIRRQMMEELSSVSDSELRQSDDFVLLFSASVTQSVRDVSELAASIKGDLNQRLKEGTLTVEDYKNAWEEVDNRLRDVYEVQSDFFTFTERGVQGLIDKNADLAQSQKEAALSDYQNAAQEYNQAKASGDTAAMEQAEQNMKTAEDTMEAAESMLNAATASTKALGITSSLVNSIDTAVAGLDSIMQNLSGVAESFGEDVESTDSSWGQANQFFETLSASSEALSGGFQSLLNGDIIGALGGVVGMFTSWIESYNKWHDRGITEDIEDIEERVEQLGKAYEDLEDTVDSTYASSKKNALEEQKVLVETQILALQSAKALEESKKDPDESALDEYDERIEELQDTLGELGESIEQALFDSDIHSEIESLGDELADAFMKGESAAEVFATSARDLTKQALNNIIKDYIQSADYIAAIEQRIREAYENDGELTQDEIDSIIAFSEALGDEFEAKYGWLNDIYENLGEDEDVTASSKGITQASQESVDEMNGRLTAIQGNSYGIQQSCQMLANTTTSILTSVRNIETFAAQISAKVNTIESNVSSLKTNVDSFALSGITMK